MIPFDDLNIWPNLVQVFLNFTRMYKNKSKFYGKRLNAFSLPVNDIFITEKNKNLTKHESLSCFEKLEKELVKLFD